MAIKLQTTAFNLIYILERDSMPGILKVGKTTVEAHDVSELAPDCPAMREAVKERYKTSATSGDTDLHIRYTEVANYVASDGKPYMFDDHDVHDVLLASNYKKANISTDFGEPGEWFEVDLEHVKQAITAVKERRMSIDGPKIEKPKYPVIVFRDEQQAAIESTLKHFKDENGKKMLWNAKMRFGKTLCALELINRMDFKRVLILTHRPTVRSGWFDDFHLIRFGSNYLYGSKKGKSTYCIDDKERKDEYERGKDIKTLQDRLAHDGTHYIYFASMQDLRGKVKDENGKKVFKDNNEPVYTTSWDFIIVDEAHEGTLTALGKEVLSTLKDNGDPKMLYLSGTPYNILSLFDENEIYTWDYVMEQEAKERWYKEHPDKPNPYEGLAKLNFYTYVLGDIFERNPDYVKSDEDYFNFPEFFRVWSSRDLFPDGSKPEGYAEGRFIHEDDVRKFLDLLCKEEPVSYFPYSNADFRSALSHTLWMLPGVAQARCLQQLIEQHKLGTEYGFKVVNVAGEGDDIEKAGDDFSKIEKKERDALRRVQDAVRTNARTITLSCGRLTTGVSVPEWTGVFMLSGGYTSKAAAYMQTVFRGQTPYKNGAIKTNCYAFDFAPDRTLSVVDEYVKMQSSSRNQKLDKNEVNKRIASTLRYVPIVAMEGGGERLYDANSFINDVNRAYADYVVGHGFKGSKLFKSYSQFTDKDLAVLEQIGKLIGGGKVKTNKKGEVIVSKGGVTGQDGENPKPSAGTKTKPPKSLPSSSRHNEERTKYEKAQDVLDKIFTRIPLLLFGAATDAEGLTVDDLLSEDFIDNASWQEFMPAKFTKDTFRQISHLIQMDRFIASTSEIIRRTRDADNLPIEERTVRMAQIIEGFHYPDKETILTPWRVVNMHMSGTIGGYDFYDGAHEVLQPSPRFVGQGEVTAKVLGNPETRILEINSKSGVYPLWLAYSLWRMRRSENNLEDEWKLWGKVLSENLYVICQTKMAEKITRRVLMGYRADLNPNTVTIENIAQEYKKVSDKTPLINKMKHMATYNDKKDDGLIEFSAVVGNPPYQKMNDGNGNGSDPLYHLFIDLGMEISEIGTLIHPARFLFNAGKTPKDWNGKMLNNPQFKVAKYWANSSEVFPSVDIKGGVAVTFWDKSKDFGKIGFFSAYSELRSILLKVKAKGEQPFSKIVGPRELYRLTDILYREHPDMEGRQSTGHKYSLSPNILDIFPELFTENVPDGNDEYIQIFGRYENRRGYRWVKKSYVQLPDNFESYKIFVPEANGTGAIGEVLSTPMIGTPMIGHADTFLSIGKFNTGAEAEACLKYIKGKFARTLLGTLKATQHNPRDTWANVPLQDFTSASDIDWSQSIADIDRYLYKKYGLTDAEISFIDKMIKPME